MKTISNPNFSIIVPGSCNASCSFCFWEKKNIYTSDLDVYINNLKELMNRLDKNVFKTLSITGGEPTISKLFSPIIKSISKERWSRVVLTTNGVGFIGCEEKINDLIGHVDHVNISRHSFSDAVNASIFKSSSVPNKAQLTEICERLNNIGIDVCLSAVDIGQIKNREWMYSFLKFAKEVGASSVAIRKEQNENSTLDESNSEYLFKDIKSIYSSSCPVCRTKSQMIKGMIVSWKSSTLEPSKDLGNLVYELIYHPDNKLTLDWEGKIEYKTDSFSLVDIGILNTKLKEIKKVDKKIIASKNKEPESFQSCGYGGGGGCGNVVGCG